MPVITLTPEDLGIYFCPPAPTDFNGALRWAVAVGPQLQEITQREVSSPTVKALFGDFLVGYTLHGGTSPPKVVFTLRVGRQCLLYPKIVSLPDGRTLETAVQVDTFPVAAYTFSYFTPDCTGPEIAAHLLALHVPFLADGDGTISVVMGGASLSNLRITPGLLTMTVHETRDARTASSIYRAFQPAS